MVGIKVFVRQKLQAIDEDAGHRDVTQGFGLLDQRNMAVMQVTHGGYEGGAGKARQVVAQIRDGVGDVHLSLGQDGRR